MKDDFKNIVSTDWLAQHLEAPDIRIIDSSWYFPQEKRNAEQEFLECHIPGASFFDIDKSFLAWSSLADIKYNIYLINSYSIIINNINFCSDFPVR